MDKTLSLLFEKKVRANSPVPLVEIQWQMLPWLLPLLIAALICYSFDLNFPDNLFLIIPLGVVALFGILFVGWVFMIEGPMADYKNAKRPFDE